MDTQNKLAKDLFQETNRELKDLVNQHWQISQANPFHKSLPEIAAKIRRVAAVLEVWKNVAKYNVTQRFFKGG